MRLNQLSLTQFRNYQELNLDLIESDVHLFIGPNGSGKTNLLEAISILSLGRSCLGTPEEDLRTWGTTFYRTRGIIENDVHDASILEIVSQIEPRKAKVAYRNDVRIPPTQIVGVLPSVLFLPQDLALFTGPPSIRRNFLDTILSQVIPDYAEHLLQYEKILRQRSALLRLIAGKAANPIDLTLWDAELAPRAAAITVARLELMEIFSLALTEEVRALGEQWLDLRIMYERGSTARSLAALTQEFLDLLQLSRERDILLQSTQVGPHRDDWRIDADGHDISVSASRGQKRVTMLALLFLEASFLELRRAEKPIVLLDDIFSELDRAHQELVLQNLAGHQVLITALTLPRLPEKTKVWSVREGKVEEAKDRMVLLV